MFIMGGNGYCDTSLNTRWDCLCFTYRQYPSKSYAFDYSPVLFNVGLANGVEDKKFWI